MTAATGQPLFEIATNGLTLRLSVEGAEDPNSPDWLRGLLQVAAPAARLTLAGSVSLSVADVAELGGIIDRLLRPTAAAVGASGEWVTADEDVNLRLSVIGDEAAIEGDFTTGWGSAQVGVSLERSTVATDKLEEIRSNVRALLSLYSSGRG